jgi:hypothetical protein
MFLAHGPVGYLANEAIQKESISKLRSHEQLIVGIFSILFGILPDIDLLILLMTKFPPFRHHEIFTHTPIFYLGIWLILFLTYKVFEKNLTKKTSKLLNPNLINILLNTFLISTLFHLAMDLITGDIMLLYPFATHRFTLTKYLLEPSLVRGYFLSTLMSIELLITAVFFKHVFKKYFRKDKWLEIFSNTVLISTILYFIFSFTLSRMTYNSSHLKDYDGFTNYDIDYDGVSDKYDLDIFNDGKDNIQDIEPTLLSEMARNIVESNKLAVGESKNVWDDIKLIYGAMDSTALITQSFYDAHKPLSPVLKDFNNRNNTYTYNSDYVLADALYAYLKTNENIVALNLNANVRLPEGKIFFVMDTEHEIRNLGITLDNNELAIVLDTDTKLQPHTYTELVSKLEDGEKVEIQN